MVLLSYSGRRGGVDNLDREGPLMRLSTGEAERHTPLLRFEPHSGEDTSRASSIFASLQSLIFRLFRFILCICALELSSI
jgi:hypothetical protein